MVTMFDVYFRGVEKKELFLDHGKSVEDNFLFSLVQFQGNLTSDAGERATSPLNFRLVKMGSFPGGNFW